MDVQSTTSWLFILFINATVFGELKVKICGKDMYRVSKNGSISCFPCENCVHGYGLHPACGSLVKHPPIVDCFPCELGISYSDEHGPSSCKKCSHCSPHEIIVKNCTVESDVVCSHTCEPGFYFENSSHNCQKCSPCCGDSIDIRIAACKASKKQCSFHNADRCTPTAKTTLSTLTASTQAMQNKDTYNKIIAICVGIFIGLIIFIVFICCLKKYRNKKRCERQNNGAIKMENGPLLQCGLKQTNFYIRLSNFNDPVRTTKLLEHGCELSIQVVCENENDRSLELCICTYRWIKDGQELNYQEGNELKIKNMSIINSGSYHCNLLCGRHNEEKASDYITVHVKPRQGEELKLLTHISLDKRQKIEKLLKPTRQDIGNWLNVGNHYGMDLATLTSMKDDDNRAEKVFEFLNSSIPKLTVFEFCEFLKTIKLNSAVIELESDLTYSTKDINNPANVSINDIRDSGVFTEEPLRVALPDSKEHDSMSENNGMYNEEQLRVALADNKVSKTMPLLNSAYCDSSREGSLDDFSMQINMSAQKASGSGSDTGGKIRKKRSFNRQGSNQSNQSAGSISSVIATAKANIVKKLPSRKNSYMEHEVDEDTDDSEVS